MTIGRSEDLDMTMMYAIHDALRRDVDAIARGARKTGDDPARLTATNFGWQIFKQFLVLHHGTEDDVLWPRVRELVADNPDDRELAEVMEREHSRIDPLLHGIDEALADRDHGHERLADLTDALALELRGHLSHEEMDALPMINRVLPFEDWARFGDEQRSRVGTESAAQYLPWLLDGAKPETVENVFKYIPPHLHEIWRTNWRQRYAQENPWSVERKSA